MKVAVLMSTYNGEKYLREQLDSILSQSDVNVMIYIRDDGSTDGTKSILHEYMSNRDNILCKFESNVGPCESFLELLYSIDTDCEYIAFSDQDDIWEKNKIKRAIELLNTDNRPSLYYSALTEYNMKTNNLEVRVNLLELNFTEALIKSNFPGCTMVINKSGVELIKSYPRPVCAIMHDWFIYQLFVGTKSRVIYDKESFIKYRVHGKNVSVVGKSFASKIVHYKNIYFKQRHIRSKALKELQIFLSEDLTKKDNRTIDDFVNYKNGVNCLFKVLKILSKTRFNIKTKMFFSVAFILKIF